MDSLCGHRFGILQIFLVTVIVSVILIPSMVSGMSINSGQESDDNISQNGPLSDHSVIKRYSEFLGGPGKRSMHNASPLSIASIKRYSEFLGGPGKRYSEFLGGPGKRYSEFLGGPGKRASTGTFRLIPASSSSDRVLGIYGYPLEEGIPSGERLYR